ncbi:MAG: hypothetical protein WCK86_23335, partial [Planctomycetia bacterium]
TGNEITWDSTPNGGGRKREAAVGPKSGTPFGVRNAVLEHVRWWRELTGGYFLALHSGCGMRSRRLGRPEFVTLRVANETRTRFAIQRMVVCRQKAQRRCKTP